MADLDGLLKRTDELLNQRRPGQTIAIERNLAKRRADEPFGPPVSVYTVTVEDDTRVALPDGGITTPARARVERDNVAFTIAAENGVATYRDLELRGPFKPELLRVLGVASLAEQATRAIARTAEGDVPFWDEALSAARHFHRARRITQEVVEQAADAYRAGGINEVIEQLFIGERQAWRYVRRAQEQGLLERQRAPRRAKGKKR